MNKTGRCKDWDSELMLWTFVTVILIILGAGIFQIGQWLL